MSKCLYCYKELEDGQRDYHPQCARNFFGMRDAPLLEYRHEDLDQLAIDSMNDACYPGNPREATKEQVIEMFRKLM